MGNNKLFCAWDWVKRKIKFGGGDDNDNIMQAMNDDYLHEYHPLNTTVKPFFFFFNTENFLNIKQPKTF